MRLSDPAARQRLFILCVCVGLFALGQFHRASGSVFSPILMDRLMLPASSIGALVSVMFLANVSSQLPFGVALDKIGARPVVSACLVVVALGTLLFAVAESFGVLILSRIAIGIGLAATGAATFVLIARTFPTREFGYYIGLTVMLGGIGGVMGTAPLAFALERWPWTTVFTVVAAYPILLILAVRMGIPPLEPAADTGAAPPTDGLLSLLKQAEFLKIMALAVVCYAPITTITGLWGGPYLQEVTGLTPEAAGLVLLCLFAGTIFTAYLFGVLDARMRSRRLLVLTSAGLSCVAIATLAVLKAPPIWVAGPLMGLIVVCQQFHVPLGAHMRKVIPEHLIGRATTLFSLASVTGIPAMQMLFGVILDMSAAAGFDVADRYRLAFAGMGAMVLLCVAVYSTARDIDSAPEDAAPAHG